MTQEQNFCARCGKRLGGIDSIHTCTLPQRTEQEPVANYCKECLTYNGHHEGCSHYTTPPQRQEPPQPEQDPVAHWSDCAVHSEPAYPKGECDCGGIVAVADYTALSDKYVALSDKYVALKAQRTWQGLTDEDRQAAFESMPDMLDGFLKTWGWLHFSKAIEAKLKQKNGFAEENA
jgi:hypothetical protein